MSLATVKLSVATRYYSADSNGEDFATDSKDEVITCDWESFQTREEFIEEIAREFVKRGASFEFTGARWAQAETYQHPHTGVWEELSMSFLDGADDALQVAVIREVGKQ